MAHMMQIHTNTFSSSKLKSGNKVTISCYDYKHSNKLSKSKSCYIKSNA